MSRAYRTPRPRDHITFPSDVAEICSQRLGRSRRTDKTRRRTCGAAEERRRQTGLKVRRTDDEIETGSGKMADRIIWENVAGNPIPYAAAKDWNWLLETEFIL